MPQLVSLTAAEAIPAIGGQRGQPLRRLVIAQADRAYGYASQWAKPHEKDIATEVTRKDCKTDNFLGKTRCWWNVLCLAASGQKLVHPYERLVSPIRIN